LDLQQWEKEGQTWKGAFLSTGWNNLQKFLNANVQANDAVAKAAAYDRSVRFTDVPDLKILQAELRPGARGKLWEWHDGVCVETVARPVQDDAGYHWKNVEKAARLIGFRDGHGLQMTCVYGSSHGTSGFSLTSYAARNHQGAAAKPAEITAMVKGKVEAKHLTDFGNQLVFSSHPLCLPFGVLPVNWNVQYPGEPYEKTRGVWYGSSPHDGSSPNAHCELPAEENPPWVTMWNVVQGFCVLLSIGVQLKFWKFDLKAAYCQMLHQVTQRWRQNAFWRWLDDDGHLQGGYFRDERNMWGMRAAGGAFYRTITTITVKYVAHQLVALWKPQCPLVIAWMAKRRQTMSAVQSLAICVQAFLDDFWFIVASGCPDDFKAAYKIIMDAFEFLGWTLYMSKFEEEGSPAAEGIFLGHHFELPNVKRAAASRKARGPGLRGN
jgi:hypothetical protein